MIPVSERGDLSKFAFAIRPPASKDELKEEACPICMSATNWKKWLVFSCGHATCRRCFKELAMRQKLHAACPLCRQLLAEGEGNRGGPQRRPAPSETTSEDPSVSSVASAV